MQGEPKVIALLQAQLKNELTAINQYFVHYRMFAHWGFERMAKKEHDESIGEMKHADALMARLFTLDALPNLQDLGKLMIGESSTTPRSTSTFWRRSWTWWARSANRTTCSPRCTAERAEAPPACGLTS